MFKLKVESNRSFNIEFFYFLLSVDGSYNVTW